MAVIATKTTLLRGMGKAVSTARSGCKGQSCEALSVAGQCAMFQVADCVCLMGLGHLEAVPVDVHVLRLAQRDYGVDQATGLTSKAYRTVGERSGALYCVLGYSVAMSADTGDRFQDMFGATAGWAQAVSQCDHTHYLSISPSCCAGPIHC